MLGADKMTVALTFAAFGSGVSVAAGVLEEIRGEGGGWLAEGGLGGAVGGITHTCQEAK